MLASRYRVVRRIGAGGMAEVLEAVALGEAGFQRRVAIKRLLSGLESDAVLLQMFLDEARIASHLHHANIVDVLDFGLADGVPFQVLQYIDGIDCQRLIRLAREAQVAIPIEVALHICCEVAHGLHHAHGVRDDAGKPLGIVHRDVSPANVFVSWDGDVRLLDFGVAFAKQRGSQTQAGVAKGTLAYMAPEQAMAGEVDGRSDVFSLGCVLHALCAGESPLAPDGRLADLVCGTPLPVDPSLPDDVRSIMSVSLQLERKDRFQTADAMAEALGAALANRIRRGAKAHTREFFAPFQSVASVTPETEDGGMFELERVAADDLEQRTFAVTTPGARRDGSSTELRDSGPGPRAPRRRVWSWGLATVGLAAGAVAIAAWLRPAETRVTDRPEPAIVDASAPDPGSRASGDPDRLAPSSPAPPDVTATTPTRAADEPPREVKRRERSSGRPHVAATRPTIDPGLGERLGYVAIGGRGALGLEIVIDGQPRGYAPRRFSLPAGAHDVSLRDAAGRIVATRRLDVTDRHTRSSPLAWHIPESLP